MMIRASRIFISSLALLLAMPVAYAEEENITPVTKAETAKPAPKAASVETPVTKWEKATDKLTLELKGNQLKQFAAIENSYRTIRAVDDVQMSVSRAVTSCSKANKDSAADYDAKYTVWKEALRPVMKDARAKLDKMVLLQDYAQPSQVRAHLKLLDAAVVYRNQGIKTVPVQEKSACDKLVENMDDTRDELVKLLTDTLALNKPLKTSADE